MAKNGNSSVMEQSAPSSTQQVSAKPRIQCRKFRLITGQHSGHDKDGITRLWYQGSIVECYLCRWIPPVLNENNLQVGPERYEIVKAHDLAKRYNAPGCIKFQEVPADTPSTKGYLLVDGNPTLDDSEQAAYEEGQEKKFQQVQQRLDGNADVFDTMDDKALRQFCEENEINVGAEVTSREALLTVVRHWNNVASPANR